MRAHGSGRSHRRGLIGARGTPADVGAGPDTHAGTATGRSRSSLAVHRLGEVSSHAGAGLGTGALIVVWLAIGAVTEFPDWWQVVLTTVGTCVTLIMVFAIQHTQSRQQSATQRKLDELIRAMPQADNHLIAVEEAPDEELQALAELNLADRETAVDH